MRFLVICAPCLRPKEIDVHQRQTAKKRDHGASNLLRSFAANNVWMGRSENLSCAGVAPLTRIDVSILVYNSAGILDDLSFLSDDLVNSWVEVVRIEGIAAEVLDEKLP
jgi:hypothetical protein